MQFAKIKGQNKVINSLIRVVKDQRISHAQLFLGQAGSGTFAVALSYAQFVNCADKQYFDVDSEDALQADSCGKCASCLKYEQLVHPDLHFCFPNTTSDKLGVKDKNESYLFIKPFREFVLQNEGYIDLESWYDALNVGNKQGVINVRDVARIIGSLSLKAYEAAYKVTIVWCFDKLHYEAAPKLLKILEEPDPNTLFFLITDNSDAILPTILSRTQLVKIPALSNDTIVDLLVKEQGLPLEEARKQAVIADGSLIKARKMELEAGSKFEEFFVNWTRATFAFAKDISSIIEMGEDFAKWGREQHRLFFAMATNAFRKSLYINVGVNTSDDFFEIKDEKFKANFPRYITPQAADEIYKLLEQADYHIQRNANAKILFCDLSIKIGKILTAKK
jgi:DNA polymerase-3 subunit delta'